MRYNQSIGWFAKYFIFLICNLWLYSSEFRPLLCKGLLKKHRTKTSSVNTNDDNHHVNNNNDNDLNRENEEFLKINDIRCLGSSIPMNGAVMYYLPSSVCRAALTYASALPLAILVLYLGEEAYWANYNNYTVIAPSRYFWLLI